MADKGIAVRDVQQALDLDSPQSIYKWIYGKSLPSLGHLLDLGCLLGIAVEEILEIDGEEGK